MTDPNERKPSTGITMDSLVAKASEIVSQLAGIQLGPKQFSMVESRLKARMLKLNLREPTAYYQFLVQNMEEEAQELLSILTTHHTYFFREISHFDFLQQQLSQLVGVARTRGDNKIRVWSAACSKGQEVYSLAMFLAHHLAQFPDVTFEILGTDVDSQSVQYAANGVYQWQEITKIPSVYLNGSCIQGSGEIANYGKITKSLRSKCHFRVENLLKLENFRNSKKFDIIFCRNVFIYFNDEQIKQATHSLLQNLEDQGFLFVGVSETLTGKQLPVQSKGTAIYCKASQTKGNIAPELPKKNLFSQQAMPNSKIADPKVNSGILPSTNMAKKIRVLVIDDSPTIRQLMEKLLSSAPDIEIVGLIDSPLKALEQIKKGGIDVITLDIHMPEMDGVTLLKNYIVSHPIPTLIISSVSMEEGPTVLTALESGAVDYVQKPSLREMSQVGPMILEKIRGAAQAQIKSQKKVTAARVQSRTLNNESLVAIGSSTGGTEALREIFECLPENIPPIVVIQHIPALFSKAFADRLNNLMPFAVKEAQHGDEVKANQVLIAPGGKQMRVVESSGKLLIEINDEAPVNRHKPSVDYTFFSIAQLNLSSVTAVILTGMGADGAKGLLALKSNGASTIAQDEKTSVVFGMPKEAALTGAVDKVLPLGEIAEGIMQQSAKIKAKAS